MNSSQASHDPASAGDLESQKAFWRADTGMGAFLPCVVGYFELFALCHTVLIDFFLAVPKSHIKRHNPSL